MVNPIATRDARLAAIHEAGRMVVAAVLGMRSGKSSGAAARKAGKRSCREAVQGPAISLAGSVAELLAEDPSRTDWQIKDCLYCDYLFASCHEMHGKGLSIDNLLEPIREARSILIEFSSLHKAVAERLMHYGSVAEAEIYEMLRGGPPDMRARREVPRVPVLVCVLLALLIEHV